MEFLLCPKVKMSLTPFGKQQWAEQAQIAQIPKWVTGSKWGYSCYYHFTVIEFIYSSYWE